jgi:iron(III) transport system substrate-binding protein
MPFRPPLLASALLLAAVAAPLHAEPLKERFAALYQAAQQEKQVVYYNTHRVEANRAFSQFWRREFPGVDLKIVQKQSLDLIPVIEAEKAAGKTLADVALINERYVADEWKHKGYWEPYKVATFDQLGDAYKDPEGSYYVPTVYLLTAAYNTRQFPDKSVLPKKLADFAAPQWQGKQLLGDPNVASSNQLFFLAMQKRGKLDWPLLEKLAQQDILFTRGNADSARLIATGERSLSFMVSSQNVVAAREKGQPIDFYVLEEGSVEVEQLVGVFKGSPHPNAAKLLSEVINSVEGQEVTAEAGAYWPTHPDATPAGHLPKLADLKPMLPEVQIGTPESKAFLTRFNQLFNRN